MFWTNWKKFDKSANGKIYSHLASCSNQASQGTWRPLPATAFKVDILPFHASPRKHQERSIWRLFYSLISIRYVTQSLCRQPLSLYGRSWIISKTHQKVYSRGLSGTLPKEMSTGFKASKNFPSYGHSLYIFSIAHINLSPWFCRLTLYIN